MKINQLAHRALYLAVASALFSPLVHAAGPVVADGIHLDILDSTIEVNTGNTSAVHALNGGTIAAENTEVVTSGDSSHGLAAVGAGSLISFVGGSLEVGSDNSNGAHARDGGQILISGTTISGSGSSHGVDAEDVGSVISISDSSITMTGTRGSALFAHLGGTVHAQRVAVQTTGQLGHGVLMGEDSVIDLSESTISTMGTGSRGVYVTGGQFNSRDVSIITSGTQAYGLHATIGGSIDATATDVSTSGLNAHGVVVDSTGSMASLNGGKVTTSGQEAHGLYSTAGVLHAANLDISTTGLGGIGVFARGADANISLSNSRVTTSDRGHAAAVLAGAQLTITNSELIASGGLGINGITARNAGTQVTVADSTIQVNGADSHGVLLSDMASARIDGSHIRSNGDRGRAVWIAGGSSLAVSNSLIEATGDSSVDSAFGAGAAVASSGGQIRLDNSQLVTTGERAGGLAVELADSHGIMTGGEIRTSGFGSTGAAVYGGDNLMELGGVHVITTGEGARGVVAGDSGSHAEVVSTIVETQGTAGHGLQAVRGASLNASNVQVQTHGDNANGVSVVDGSTMNVSDSQIQTAGLDAYAANVQDGASLAISGSVLHSVASTAFRLDQGTITATDGTHIAGGNGRLAEFASDAPNTLTFSGDVTAVGDIRFSEGAVDVDGNGSLDRTSSLSLDSNSIWRGATDALGDVSLTNNSRWDVSGDSLIGGLSMTDSAIVFDHADGAYKTLTIDGDFHADNGVLVMNSMLGDDNSPTDRLHVQGNTSGNAHIAVNNIGGHGAKTEDGIMLVQVDGVSGANYELAGRAVGGAYEYFLHQGGIADPADGDWYLRSQLEVAPIDDCIINPEDPACVDPIISPPVERPETGVYLANQAAAVGMFDLTMHERIGEPNLVERQKTHDHMGGAWARVTTDHNRSRIDDQLGSQGRQHVLQVGADLTRWGDNDRGVLGVMVGNGEATQRVLSQVTGYAAEGRVKGRAAGLYGSWLQNSSDDGGLYVDGWVQTARFRNTTQGDALQRERYDSRSTSASVEAGYAFNVHLNANSALYLEPQAQVIWSDFRMDGGSHVEANGTEVRVADAGGIRTRVGVRLFGHATVDNPNRVQPFAALNWIRQHGNANAVWMDDVTMSGAAPRDLYEAKGGVQVQLTRGLTAWGELSVGRGAQDYRNYGGLLGVKYAW